MHELIIIMGNNNSAVFSNSYWHTYNSTIQISKEEFAVGVGGLFFENSSSTWLEKSSMYAAGVSSERGNWNGTGDIWGTDVLHLKESFTLDHFPVDTSKRNSIDLGENSTFLNSLRSSGLIASRTFSIFWGFFYQDSSSMDGMAVFGGYDQAKTTGEI